MSDSSAASQTDQGTGNGDASSGSKPTWIEQLPEDIRGDTTFHSFKTIGDFAKAHKTVLSEREGSVRVPGEKATDADRNAFYNALGRPETPDGYKFTAPEGLDEKTYNQDVENTIRKFFHDSGIPQNEANKLYSSWWSLVKEGQEATKTAQINALEKINDELSKEWPGDKFKENEELAKRAFTKFAGESDKLKAQAESFFETVVDNVALGNHPVFLRIFAAIGKAISGDSMHPGSEGGNQLSLEDQAKKRFPNTKWK